MTPTTYRAALAQLGLTHEEAARLLAIHPVTSRKSKVNETAARLLRLIYAYGVEEACDIIGIAQPPQSNPPTINQARGAPK